MSPETGISFTGIAGILPQQSRFSDVTRILGVNYEVERIPGQRSEGWMFRDKSVLHYRDRNIAVAFIDPGFKLLPNTLVTVIGVEIGCTLQTEDGLCAGMSIADAMAIIDRNYTVRDQSSGWIDILSPDGKSPTFLALHHDNYQVEFIGLHEANPRLLKREEA